MSAAPRYVSTITQDQPLVGIEAVSKLTFDARCILSLIRISGDGLPVTVEELTQASGIVADWADLVPDLLDELLAAGLIVEVKT